MSEINPIPGVSKDPALAALFQSAQESKAAGSKMEQDIKASREREAQARAAQAAALKPKQDQLQTALGASPTAPESKPIPAAPQQMPFDQKEMGETLALITTLAALGGAITRQPLTTALNAFSQGVHGFLKGDHDAYESKLKEFHAGVEKAKNENEQVWKKYLAAKDKYKTDIAGLQNELKLIAAETQSPIDMELAKQGDVTSIYKMGEKAREKYQTAAATAARVRETARSHAETVRHHQAMEEEKKTRDAELKAKAEAEAKAKDEKAKADAKKTQDAAKAKAETERRQRVRTFAASYTDADSVKKAVKEGKLGSEMGIAILQEKFGFEP